MCPLPERGRQAFATVLARRHAEHALEMARQMGLIRESGLYRDLRDGDVSCKERLRQAHTHEYLIGMRRQSGLVTEHATEVEWPDACHTRQRVE